MTRQNCPPYCGYISSNRFCSRTAWLWLRAKMIDLPTRVPVASRMPFSIRLRRMSRFVSLLKTRLVDLGLLELDGCGHSLVFFELLPLLLGHLANT